MTAERTATLMRGNSGIGASFNGRAEQRPAFVADSLPARHGESLISGLGLAHHYVHRAPVWLADASPS